MVPVHRVGLLARFGTSQCVAQVAVRIEGKSVRGRLEKRLPSHQHRTIEGEMGGMAYESGYFSSL